MTVFQRMLNRLTTRRGARFAHLQQLLRMRHLPQAAIQQHQLQLLNALLNHAGEHVPYYRDLFAKRSNPGNRHIQLRSLEELNAMPLLDKTTIREQGERMLAGDRHTRSPYNNTSGGSTGTPIIVTQDREYFEHDMAQTLFVNHWRGAGPFDSQAVIWGADRDTYAGKKSWDVYVRDFVRNRVTLNSFNMGPEDMRRMLAVLDRKRPRLIHAYSKSIAELARFGRREGITVRAQQAIHATADTLHVHERADIESYFGCKVYNHFGNREVGAIASECGHSEGLHVLCLHNHVEVLRPDGTACAPGETGEVVVTNLANYSMPLIRYRIGDKAVAADPLAGSQCPCGWAFPMLESVVGRTVDVFRTRDGRSIDGIFFQHALYFIESIDCYQVIQDDFDKVRYLIVAKSKLTPDQEQKIIHDTRLVMGQECEIKIEYVLELPLTPTGKRRYIISNLSEGRS